MRQLLDDMDPLFAGAAIAIAGLTLIAHLPHPPIVASHPPLDLPLTSPPYLP